MTNIIVIMLDLSTLGEESAKRRKTLKLSQTELSRRAGVSRETIDALENARIGELGFSKVTRLLNVLGMELRLEPTRSRRPTLDELMQENLNDQDLVRRG